MLGFVKVFVLFMASGFLIPLSSPASAQFQIDRQWIEFTANGPDRQDIQITSLSAETQYIQVDAVWVRDPGQPSEQRLEIDNPDEIGLLATPKQLVLPAGASRVVRLLNRLPAGDRDRIYRVTIRPVIAGVEFDRESSGRQTGMKILVAYGALIIARPETTKAEIRLTRDGKKLTIENRGNTLVHYQNGEQCSRSSTDCIAIPGGYIFAGASVDVPLEVAGPGSLEIRNMGNIEQYSFD